jgi:hypothetical protein
MPDLKFPVALTASEIARLLQPRYPRVSRADLEEFAQELLREIYQGLQRGAQVCLADPVPGGTVTFSYLVIGESGRDGRS